MEREMSTASPAMNSELRMAYVVSQNTSWPSDVVPKRYCGDGGLSTGTTRRSPGAYGAAKDTATRASRTSRMIVPARNARLDWNSRRAVLSPERNCCTGYYRYRTRGSTSG